MYKNKSLVGKKVAKQQGEGSHEKENGKHVHKSGSIQKAIETLNNLQKLSKLETSASKFMGCT